MSQGAWEIKERPCPGCRQGCTTWHRQPLLSCTHLKLLGWILELLLQQCNKAKGTSECTKALLRKAHLKLLGWIQLSLQSV